MRSSVWAAAVVTVIVGGSLAAGQPASSPEPARNVGQLVARAGRYVVDYGEKMSLLVAVEHYTQRLRSTDGTPPVVRALVSEFALVRVADDWVGFRDVFEVDGARVRDRRDRLLALLIGRSDDGWLQGRRIAEESARYNLGAVQRDFNTPTMALFFLHPKNRERFHYTKSGEDTIDGMRVWSVKYKETDAPTIVRTTTGRDVPASGVFWIDPATGRVVRTRMDLRAEIERAAAHSRGGSSASVRTTVSITVSYEPDARFGLLLPSEMRESYDTAPAGRATGRETPTTITCVATYSDFRTFETSGRLIVR